MTMTFIQSSGNLGANSGFTFTNIPTTFTHLQLRIFARSHATAETLIFIRVNADFATTTYRNHFLYADGATAFAGDYGTGRNYLIFQFEAPNNATANVFGTILIDILDYANTNKNKVFRSIGGYDNNGSGAVAFNSGLWPVTSAITQLDVGSFTGGLAANSRIDLYGITVSDQTGA